MTATSETGRDTTARTAARADASAAAPVAFRGVGRTFGSGPDARVVLRDIGDGRPRRLRCAHCGREGLCVRRIRHVLHGLHLEDRSRHLNRFRANVRPAAPPDKGLDNEPRALLSRPTVTPRVTPG